MNDALIGYTGFVGSTLLKQRQFDHLYNSKNITDIQSRTFDLAICGGVSAVKWLANKAPEEDWANISMLINALKTIKAKHFILISTIDVYPNPIDVDERTVIDPDQNSAYGKHRRYLEQFVEKTFPHYMIIRLPGLFGEGIKKNVIFDFIHGNEMEKINPKGQFQFYNLENLWADIQTVLDSHISLINFSTEPVTVAEVYQSTFGKPFENMIDTPPAIYDMRSIFAEIFASKNNYLYQKKEILDEIKHFILDERQKL